MISVMINSQTKTLAEKLGFDRDAKLLIIHADDAGVSNSTNRAVMEAFEKGWINSTSIIVPASWFPEMVNYAMDHPEFDYGLHLAFTSEWHTCKWSGIACMDEIQSLLDKTGYFFATTGEAVKHGNPQEVETEMQAQIEKALAMGMKPSHLDSHMNTHFGTPELFRIYLKLGEKYRIPLLIPENYLAENDSLQIPELEKHIIINKLYEIGTEIPPSQWAAWYTEVLQNMQPGVNELIFHLAYDDAETRSMTSGHEYYDAAWRQRDLDYAMSEEFRKFLKDNDIQLITWKDIQKVIYPQITLID
jgi:hypothetical protein